MYGTEFWVNTRADAQASQPSTVSCQLALVSGSISFTPANGKEAMLKPGQELSIVNSQLSITDVDTAPYVAWNTGNFVFDDCPLEQLTDVLARWYGMKVRFYSDSSRHILFTGILSRYADVMTSLESISAVANVEITIEGNTIIVK